MRRSPICVHGIVDVHPDGTANARLLRRTELAHRQSNADPRPMVPGEATDIEMVLDACGYRLAPGHRIRPFAFHFLTGRRSLPSPTDPTLEIELGSVKLGLPLARRASAHRMWPEPTDPDPLPRYESLASGANRRIVERDLASGLTQYRVLEDTGLNRHPENGLAGREIREETWSIRADDPLSMTGESRWTSLTEREGWQARTQCVSTLACTETDWLISASVEGFHNDKSVFSRTRTQKIPRDHM